MFRNYLAAALRNLVRNRLYAAINIIGLAVGFAAALLIALFVRNEFSYDSWIPDYQRTYLLTDTITLPGQKAVQFDLTGVDLGPLLKLSINQIEGVTRLVSDKGALRHGDIEANETILWADDTLFAVLKLPALAGNVETALRSPDSIVLTRSAARKYFGRDTPVGETLDLNRTHAMTITAVIEDFPANSNLTATVFGSGNASYSRFRTLEAQSPQARVRQPAVFTYLKAAAGAPIDALQRDVAGFLQRHDAEMQRGAAGEGIKHAFSLLGIGQMHLVQDRTASMTGSGNTALMAVLTGLGVLIVGVAAINFVCLMTARSARRIMEVCIRKVEGAARRDLIVQFIGESVIYALAGTVVALVLVQLVLPAFNGFLHQDIAFDCGRDPALLGMIVGLPVLVGVLAGIYPALVLSGFRPAMLKNLAGPAAGSARVRQGLVVVQFAILTTLVLATAVMYRQVNYALNDALRLDKDQMLLVTTGCRDTFKNEVAALRGVQGVACSSPYALGEGTAMSTVILPNGVRSSMGRAAVDFGFFEMYGLRPIAGRFFSADRAEESLSGEAGAVAAPPAIVINETAMRRLGFPSPDMAVGQEIRLAATQAAASGMTPSLIIGVAPDFTVRTVNEIPPMVYFVNPRQFGMLNIKMNGRDLPETLAAIDRLWKQFGEPRPIARSFLDQNMEMLFANLRRQAEMFTSFAGIAVFIAGLGLFGLAAFTAERRTKEIGVRKAMGASSADILRLLIWQFTQPVLGANVIAWPAGYYVMKHWLEGFAYHIDLAPWMFLAASMLTLAIAVLTVIGHALLVARAEPVTALRYE